MIRIGTNHKTMIPHRTQTFSSQSIQSKLQSISVNPVYNLQNHDGIKETLILYDNIIRRNGMVS